MPLRGGQLGIAAWERGRLVATELLKMLVGAGGASGGRGLEGRILFGKSGKNFWVWLDPGICGDVWQIFPNYPIAECADVAGMQIF